jgi:hypothetical protein
LLPPSLLNPLGLSLSKPCLALLDREERRTALRQVQGGRRDVSEPLRTH